jgi:dolichyl-diphosphooligosaccharide--protein glycosyltransferase
MLRNIRSAGGGIHGIRRGVKFLHIFGVIFIAFLVILPSAFVAFDAAVPTAFTKNRTSVLKIDMFGEDHQGAFGLGVGKEGYWVDAFSWLNEQDNNIKDPTLRPAFISWWDYGFYEVAVGGHPTVADNFQDGIPTAANFHTSTSEREAVAIFSVRLLEGHAYFNNDDLSNNVQDILVKYVGEENKEKIKTWIKEPTSSPSYGDPIGAEYDKETSKDYRVGQQYPENAVYHDIVDIFLNNATYDSNTDELTGLTDEQITCLYHDLQQETGYSIRYYGVEGYDRSIFNIFGFLADKSLLLINGIEDDFIKLTYKGYTVDSQGNKLSDKTWDAKEIIEMSPEDRRYVVVTNTQQVYKDLYFDTMFYRVYIGPSQGESGSKQEFDYQLPCLNMKHFYAEYMADLAEYPYYGTGKSSVVIAKYYEGAYLNGTVTFLGEPITDAQITVQKNLTYYTDFSLPIDHDSAIINESGKFNVIAGAGNITLQIRKNVGEGSYILKNVTLNGPKDSEFAPISDDDAMRRNNSNYERNLNITINPASISGYVYDDIDDDEIFNETIDKPLSDVTVTLFRIVGINQEDESIELDTENPKFFDVNDTGQYHISDLLPGIYRLVVTKDDYNIHLTDVTLEEGKNTYNARNSKLSALEGVVFIDADGDAIYDPGEELLKDVDVELSHQDEIIGTYKTDDDGYYSFDQLIPGLIENLELNEYVIKAVKAPNYESELAVYPVENDTTVFNISIGLSPVKISGIITYNGAPVEDVQLDFAIDKTVENNTAVRLVTRNIEDGTYSTSLTPGSYIVNLTKDDEDGQIILYSLSNQKLNLSVGQGSATKNFALEKSSVTVSGTTTYLGFSIENIEITFEKEISDPEPISASVISDENGLYSIELPVGNYTVEALSEEFTENNITYNYKYTSILTIKETDIIPGIKFDIETLKVIPE